jgi:hypothetical protein
MFEETELLPIVAVVVCTVPPMETTRLFAAAPEAPTSRSSLLVSHVPALNTPSVLLGAALVKPM